MTIEATLQSIDGTLISIATSLELIAGAAAAAPKPTKAAAKPKVKPTPSTKSAKESAETSDAGEDKKESPSPEKATTKKADAPKGPKLDDVRTALGALQKATSSSVARALLADVGEAPTLSKLSQDMYQAVIDAAAAATEEAG